MLYGDEIASSVKRNQVYQATHNGEGQSLPYMSRSFISFTYGGKKIEDFDLLATISGERLNRAGYASFEDTITTYDNLDGQRYWATHYKTNQIDFTLSTDGIEQRVLDDFLSWFRAGTSRELILAEHPNRAIMARVAQPPQLNLLPFESNVTFKVSSVTRQTKTTLYKGDITLSLVMDEPHWYSIMNILGKKSDVGGHQRYEDVWTDVTTGNEISIFASQDALKILYEDGIPLGSMIERNMLLGNGAYANVENQVISLVWSKSEEDEDFEEGEGAKIDSGDGTVGIIAGAIVDASDNGIAILYGLNNSNNYQPQIGYFFYAGTAPSPTTISFTLTPSLSGYYVSEPCNTYAKTGSAAYNTFTIESVNKQELRFTTPNIYTSYNKAQNLFETYGASTYTWEHLRNALRNNVRHAKVREYAIAVVNAAQGNADNSATISTNASALMDDMKKFLVGSGSIAQPAFFEFDSKTGEAIGTFSYYDHDLTLVTDQKEDVGDMLHSNYIILQDKNYPTTNGRIEGWTVTNPQYSHRIYHDVQGGLSNLQILYKNMYF